jgi:bisphosphoglycerate-independent phosphoglycerate mutase (AlkP superfamily)
MPKKKKKKSHWHRQGKIYISPDGGETVYEQKRNGERGRMVEQSQMAQDIEQLQAEEDMYSIQAIQLRRKYPALKKAWERYCIVWNMITHQDEDN